jgi:hypothetical protein
VNERVSREKAAAQDNFDIGHATAHDVPFGFHEVMTKLACDWPASSLSVAAKVACNVAATLATFSNSMRRAVMST